MSMFKKTFPTVTLTERKLKIGAGLLFWPWNLLCLCLVFFGLVPRVLVDLVRETARGLIPWNLTLAVFCLMAIPLLSVAWGTRLFRHPRKLVALLYGLEVPLCLVFLFRIFLVRELTPALALVGGAFLVACGCFAYELAREPGPRVWGDLARLCGHTVAGLTSFYLGAILAFYVPVVAVAFGKEFFAFEWVRPVFRLISEGRILFFLVAVLVAFSAVLFLAAPLAFMFLHRRSFFRVFERCRVQVGRSFCRIVVATTAVLVVGLFIVLSRQPQRLAFQLLSTVPSNDAERARLLASRADIRRGLLEAYLSPYRYLSARGENTHLAGLYQKVLHFPPGASVLVEGAQKALLAPLLYDGESMRGDQDRALKLYASFFDTPIQRKERSSILQALAATWNREERSAGLLNQDQRQVKLVRQEIRVEQSWTTATVEIHDQYQNQTNEIQEIFLSFSLPESAVVTGLWLGDSESREKRFAFKVSPRGAAQAVYRGEVARRADPALVEQVGPGQYRLRAFPVPPKSQDNGQAPAFHLWLTYAAHPSHGFWPTPRLSERRNVYWDVSTAHFADGQRVRPDQEEWVGARLPAHQTTPSVTEEAVLPGGYLVRREPFQPNQLPDPKGQRFAIVVDRSYSMATVREELEGTLAEIERLGKGNVLDFYLTSAATRGEPAERVDTTALGKPLQFFGGGSLKQWLRQFDKLRANSEYHGLFVITDGDSLDSADDTPPPDTQGAPLWMVHLGGRVAAGYDDPTLELLNRSGGGVATNFWDALRRHAARGENDAIINVDGSSLWTLHKTSSPETPMNNFSRLAARQLILTLGRRHSDVAALDEIHRLAVKYGEVSLYSSMIVLVDEAQRSLLEEAEKHADRFSRHVESGEESLQHPTNPLAFAATPEPHEWVLIGLAVVAAAIALRQRRQVLADQRRWG
jgi:putative PEP-CTERM system integral membrane protein